MGLAKTLNKGISLAKGKYIARQDNDDISYPDRLKLEVNFLEKHPDYALVGAQARIINEQGIDTGRKHLHATKSPQLCFDLVFDNPFVHSSVLFNKQMLFNVGGYDANHNFFEDHNLWSRISRTNKIANLPNVLLDYREVGTGMSKSEKKYSDQVRNQTKLNLSYYFSFSENEINHLAEIYHSGYKTKKEKQLLKSLGKNLIELIFTSENENEKKTRRILTIIFSLILLNINKGDG